MNNSSQQRTVLRDALDAVAVEAVVAALRRRAQPILQPHCVPQQPLLLENAYMGEVNRKLAVENVQHHTAAHTPSK